MPEPPAHQPDSCHGYQITLQQSVVGQAGVEEAKPTPSSGSSEDCDKSKYEPAEIRQLHKKHHQSYTGLTAGKQGHGRGGGGKDSRKQDG